MNRSFEMRWILLYWNWMKKNESKCNKISFMKILLKLWYRTELNKSI